MFLLGASTGTLGTGASRPNPSAEKQKKEEATGGDGLSRAPFWPRVWTGGSAAGEAATAPLFASHHL